MGRRNYSPITSGFSRWDHGVFPAWRLAVLAIVLLVVLLASILIIRKVAQSRYVSSFSVDAIATREATQSRLNHIQEYLKYLAHDATRGGVSHAVLQRRAREHEQRWPNIVHIGYLTPSGDVVWIASPDDTPSISGVALLDIAQEGAFQVARSGGSASYSEPFVAGDQWVFDVYAPLADRNGVQGVFTARCDLETTLLDFIPEMVQDKNHIAVNISRKPSAIVMDRGASVDVEYAQTVDLKPPFATVSLTLTPYRTGIEILSGALFYFSLLISLLLASSVVWLSFVVARRREAEMALASSERRFRTLADMAPVGIGLIDEKGRTVFANGALRSLLQVEDAEKVENQSIDLLLPEEAAKHIRAKAASTTEPERSAALETQIPGRKGKTSDVMLNAARMDPAMDASKLTIVTALDVSEQKRAEEERREFEHRIQQSQKLESLGVLAGGIAHDFNNLLVGVTGNASLALEQIPRSSPAYQPLQNVQTAAARAADLTGQLLAYSGKGHFTSERVYLSELVRDMAPLLSVSNINKTNMRYDLGSDLPEIQADPTQIRQIIMNLIINALEATSGAQGRVRVQAGVMWADSDYIQHAIVSTQCEPGEYVFLEVEDNGCGMSAETQSKLFDPFFTTKFTGRGLGMSAVLGIVRAHSGFIRLRSAPGGGTCFRILFPAVGAPEDRTRSREVRAEGDGPVAIESVAAGGVVLVIDDEVSIRSLVKTVLEKKGFTVHTADDGMAGVEQFRHHASSITLVLLDLTMPRMNGEAVFRELRAMRADIPVIFSSGYYDTPTQDLIGREPMTSFLHKPYMVEELVSRITELLHSRAST